jgi:hypothetical protein
MPRDRRDIQCCSHSPYRPHDKRATSHSRRVLCLDCVYVTQQSQPVCSIRQPTRSHVARPDGPVPASAVELFCSQLQIFASAGGRLAARAKFAIPPPLSALAVGQHAHACVSRLQRLDDRKHVDCVSKRFGREIADHFRSHNQFWLTLDNLLREALYQRRKQLAVDVFRKYVLVMTGHGNVLDCGELDGQAARQLPTHPGASPPVRGI